MRFLYALLLTTGLCAAQIPGWSAADLAKTAPVTSVSGDAITIDNTANSIHLTNYPVRVPVTFKSGMEADFSDVRFRDSDGTTYLSYWLESYSASASATFWVRLPLLLNSAIKTIYMDYVGTPPTPVSDGNATFDFWDDFSTAYFRNGLTNASGLLTNLPTYDGSGQAVHPSVVDMTNAWPDANGFRYWMAMTPYPATDDSYENPSVLCSTNGTDWQVPPNLTNPLTNTPPHGHHNDTDLVYVPQSNAFYLYYNWAHADETNQSLWLYTSTTGTNWTGPQKIADFAPSARFVSPSVTVLGPESWVMYSISTSNGFGTTAQIEKRTSTNGINWSTAQAGTLSNPPVASTNEQPWHITVRWIPGRSEWWALYNSATAGTLARGNLWFATSSDGLSWSNRMVMYNSTAANLWDSGIYRSSFIYYEDSGLFKVWYSAVKSTTWRMGYTVTDSNILNARWVRTLGTWDHETNSLRGISASGLSKVWLNQVFGDAQFHFNVKYASSGFQFSEPRYRTDTDRYLLRGDQANSYVQIRNNNTATPLAGYTNAISTTANYTNLYVTGPATNFWFLDSTYRMGTADASHTNRGLMSLAGWTGRIFYDNAFVRPFTTVEPTVTVP